MSNCLAPLSERDLDALVNTPRLGRTLHGWRDTRPGDATALATIIRVIGHAACAHPEIGELEINPVKVRAQGHGAFGLDLRVHLTPVHH